MENNDLDLKIFRRRATIYFGEVKDLLFGGLTMRDAVSDLFKKKWGVREGVAKNVCTKYITKNKEVGGSRPEVGGRDLKWGGPTPGKSDPDEIR